MAKTLVNQSPLRLACCLNVLVKEQGLGDPLLLVKGNKDSGEESADDEGGMGWWQDEAADEGSVQT